MRIKDDFHRRNLLRRLRSVFQGETQDVIVIGVYAAAIGLCSLAIPIAVQALVSSVALASVIQPLVVLTAFVGGVLAFSGCMWLLQLWAVEMLQRRLMVRGSISLAHALPEVRPREFSSAYGPDYTVRYMELFALQKLAAVLILDGSAVSFQILVGLLLVSFYHPFFLAAAFVLLLCLGFIVFVLGMGAISTSESESEAKYSAMGWLQTLARSPELFKSSVGKDFAVQRMDQLVCRYIENRSRHFAIVMRQNVAAVALHVFASALLLGLGGWLVIRGQLTLGQLIAAELVFSLVLASTLKLGVHLEKFYDLAASVTKLDSFFDLPYERSAGAGLIPTAEAAALKIQDLTVRTAGYTTPLLDRVSISLGSGDKAVLFGSNASGKSVLADIINRTTEPESGWVEIDQHPVSEIQLLDLRNQVAIVRMVELFPGTVEDNLLLGNKDVSPAEIRRTLELVGLQERVYGLNEGLMTLVSSAGQPFSSGEALRLMVARALLGRPRLLIIDGTLDAMDDASEDMMTEVLRERLPNLTVLLLTHEMRLARSLHRSFAIENGRIIERGAAQ